MRLRLYSCFAAFFFACTPAIAKPTENDSPKNLTILADPSLALPLSELARNYTRTQGVATMVVMLGAQDTAQQIEQGMEANLVVTADSSLRESLNTQGLIDVYSREQVASTRLALVAPASIAGRSNLAQHISFAAILFAQPDLPIYVSDASTLEGARAKQLMQTVDYPAPLKARTVTFANHAEVMKQLNLHPGFVLMLAADALHEPSLKVLALLPSDVVDAVHYEAMRVAGADSESTHSFLNYLESADAQTILHHYGFQPPQE